MSDRQIHVSAAPFPPVSRFKPRLAECLSALHCLPYFIQYLEYCKSVRLLHFLFACESFREVANKATCPEITYPNSPTRAIKSTLQNDALDIYVQFVSMNATSALVFPENIRQAIENHISTEDGAIDYRCYDGAVAHVRHILQDTFVPKFHKSSYCTSYQLEVLRKDVCLADLLLCETSMEYFVEFLEQKKQANHVLFWVAVEAFNSHLRRIGGVGGRVQEIGGDAIALYETYLSLQARKPVNYGRIIRGIVESSISPDDGVITPDAFLIAQQYSYHFMDKFFFEAYLKSEQHKQFKTDANKQLERRRKEEYNIKINSSTLPVKVQLPTIEVEVISLENPTTSQSPRLKIKAVESLPGISKQKPGSSIRSSSPSSSKTSSPRSSKRRNENHSTNYKDIDTSSNGTPRDDPADILDDREFWKIRPDQDYPMSQVDAWGVYRTNDKHLLNSPPQGSDKIKKSVMKLFGKEEISEEAAAAKARSIVEDVMNLTTRPLDLKDLLEGD